MSQRSPFLRNFIIILGIVIAAASIPVTMIMTDVWDTNPDSTFYSLEQSGEAFREAIGGGVEWHADRCLERAQEAEYMVGTGDYLTTLQLVSACADQSARASIPATITDNLEMLENRLASTILILEVIQEEIVEDHVGTVGGFQNTVEEALDRIRFLQEVANAETQEELMQLIGTARR